ncbi:hypothetical protein BO85DRAFT_266732 [Aspergillus piperis CBS 112811]|uniref:Uncharacterized protein n=1 Tax=Aspergillus piperis CBS 112811 TaxID=1448313 RepID=A0A8G1R9J1_9EURO|nr:hypothetical protein BO85DRAFT_266732 [Aspergillus piperis CBS 112811]RAH59245.1 hypothetical protein BO85DRAFT_266732 [Aspergillus piperis CBS 112811]
MDGVPTYYRVLGRSPCTMHTHAPDGMIMIGVFSIAGFLTTSNPRYFVSPLKGTNHMFWSFGIKGCNLHLHQSKGKRK